MGGFGRAVLLGAFVAVLLAAGIAIAGYFGLLGGLLRPQAVERLLVIAVAPDKGGADAATIAFVLEADGSRPTVLNTLEPVAIAGTSANNAREALPFGGGNSVAEALVSQTGGEALSWAVLPAATWEKLVDDAGGVTASVPTGVSVYADGRLTIVDPGTRTLTGAEAVALASAIDYIDGEAVRRALADSVSAGLSTAVSGNLDGLNAALRASSTATSLSKEQILGFPGAQR